MSRISENIRKITKAWGGKTTGNGISDALSDLYNNLPFGTKVETVEILSETKTVGYTMNDGEVIDTHEKGGLTTYLELDTNVVYDLVLDGNHYKATVVYEEVGDGMIMGFLSDNATDIDNAKAAVQIMNDPLKEACGTNVYCMCSHIVNGKPIDVETISISTEQETVTPIPQKYLPEPVIFTHTGEQNYTCNKTYNECVNNLYQNVFLEIAGSICPASSIQYYDGMGIMYIFGTDIMLAYAIDGTISQES